MDRRGFVSGALAAGALDPGLRGRRGLCGSGGAGGGRPDAGAAPPNGNRIALISATAVIDLDERVQTTPLELRFQFDPAVADLGTRIHLTTNPDDHHDKAAISVTLRRLSEGRHARRMQVTLHAGHFSYGRWTRTLPAGWQESWDGRLTLAPGEGRVAVMLGAREVLAVATDRSGRFRRYHVAVVPGEPEARDGGRVTLRRIATAWRTPEAMTAMDRLRLVDAGEFDAEAFADLLAAELARQDPPAVARARPTSPCGRR